MATFAGTNLSNLGTIDLGSRYVPQGMRKQITQRTVPGVSGSLVMVGGKLPEQFALPMRLQGSGNSVANAGIDIQTNKDTVEALVGTTGTFVDDNQLTITDTVTLIAVQPVGPYTYHSDGTNTVASLNLALVFVNARTS